MAPYLTLFLAAFVAATLLPAQSEAVLVFLLSDPALSATLLVATATLGNVLGSVVNWYCGRVLRRFRGRRWFPVSERGLARAEAQYHRWGRWSLLASWVPFIGDPLTVMAGLLREPLWSFVLIVTLAKGGRYVAVMAVARAWL
ncbi:YqaA family protein [Vannielia sp. SX4]|uniref:YqaA family protein n=1 Tax=Vannielia sp. SX4 TaxID=3463852 RepID=UPI004058DF4B